ncbi:E6 [Pan paniscus papillomavirus 1]|uniref:Protein E6 n=1 Tax=Pygmy chimpanzee papillomavirus type 1 TaxID=10576 RepID=VE6_PCPV1|nr:RecName: Full=Protein E6 [Pygmy chimpanzee papillomavirus type 1]pir/W6WLC1/ E6 protein - pygmy chimpanzee papillomavirus (type 1) [Pygmy chimpanzee papillomavirus type 1]QBA86134.1 E6 [Pan paniscus papillomavirus 1]CAA44655.1 E6 [Pygmy chimpanzee papillomavirus type 1]
MEKANASTSAKTIDQLCKECNLCMHSLQILCVFCRKTLSTAEVYAFQYKDLNIVWQGNFPFAACACCLEIQGKVNQYRHFDFAAYAVTVEEEINKSIFDVRIRCYLCHKPLCDVEKLRHILEKARFIKLNCEWKGRCFHCWTSCMENILP